MAIYSIKELEQISGIKAHTIRVWEQRYGIVQPKRTETNIRYYEDGELQILLKVALLKKHGLRISKIARMSQKEIAEQTAKLVKSDCSTPDNTMEQIIEAMVEMNETKFDQAIARKMEQCGFEHTLIHVLHSFQEKLPLLRLTNTFCPAQENFITHLIHQKLIAEIDNLPSPAIPDAPKYLLFLPKGYATEFSLQFMHYMLKQRGNKCLYLGVIQRLQDVQDAYARFFPDFLFTVIDENFTADVYPFISEISTLFPKTQIVLSGYIPDVQKLTSSGQVIVLQGPGDVCHFLNK